MASTPLVQDSSTTTAGGAYCAGPRRARLTALHLGVGAAHIGAAAAVVIAPGTWPWALGAVAASHAFVAAQTLFPRGQLLGPALIRLPQTFAQRGAVALTFDDGPDPLVTPQALDMLDRAGAKATFFCIGERVRRFPALAREIVARGHAVENHSYAHSPYAGFWGPRRVRRDVMAAQDAIADVTGVAPIFFRPPFGVRNPLLEPVLAGVGLHCVIWSARAFDTIARDAGQVVQRLLSALDAGAIALLHDGIAVRERTGPPILAGALPAVLAALGERGLHSINLRSITVPA
jgi:peptidoglycan/xylan/chitin deacetylase (PgdA/CDA1 family)